MNAQLLHHNQNFLYYLFHLTAGGLYGLSLLTKISYQCWNIIIWFGIIPASWIYLVSRRTSVWVNLLSVPIFAYLFFVATWDKWFNKAVVWLNEIATFIESDYKLTSVYVCVFIPLLVHSLLLAYCSTRHTFKNFLIGLGICSALVVLFFPLSNMYLRTAKL